ncbi:MAG: GDP-L-fucose synthase [Pirellulaceae bacterium]|nr:GDP-L-fucose synthase [Pirellulaceae bacterium]
MMERIFVAGHRGMVGSAVVRALKQRPGCEVITVDRSQIDLTRDDEVDAFIEEQQPDGIIFAAAKVGGILANNSYPVQFLSDNLRMAVNTIDAAHRRGVRRFLFLGSTCIYPKHAPQPIQESSLLDSQLEPTNEAYALAKIAGLKLCQYYRRQYGAMYHSAMPTNLYGPGDNYHPQNSHVLPALVRRIHEAHQAGDEQIVIWGTGSPRREFLYVEDLASALLHLYTLDNPPDWVNVGTGVDLTILELAQMICRVVGYRGNIVTDPTKPDGTPRKLTDISLLRSTGWAPSVDLEEGLRRTYASFLQESADYALRAV